MRGYGGRFLGDSDNIFVVKPHLQSARTDLKDANRDNYSAATTALESYNVVQLEQISKRIQRSETET